MERESFSSSRRRAAASEVHHLARLPAGWCRRPGLHPHAACSNAGRELGEGGRNALIVRCSKSKPDLDLVPEATPLVVTQFSISHMPAESQPVW